MNQFYGFIGIILGFVLSQYAMSWREFWSRKRAKKLILEELSANLALIPQKIDLVNKIRTALIKKELLSGESVPFITRAYDRFVLDAFFQLSTIQRDSLHVIYERMKQVNSYLPRFESELLNHLNLKIVNDPFAMYITRMDEILNSLGIVERLIEKYLEGKPVDVFYRATKQ